MSTNSHQLGLNGFNLIADTETHTAGAGDHTDVEAWGPLVVIEDTQFAAGTAVLRGDAPSTTATYAAGTVIHAVFTSIDLASGVVHAQRILEVDEPFTYS